MLLYNGMQNIRYGFSAHVCKDLVVLQNIFLKILIVGTDDHGAI